MKRFHILFLSLFISSLSIIGQITIKGKPESFISPQLKSIEKNINSRIIGKLDIQKYLAEDQENKVSNRYSIYKKVNIDILKEGNSIKSSNGHYWLYKIKSENSLSISIIFSEFNLPKGARLFIYNPEKTLVRGAYSHLNNKPYGGLTLADFPGDEIVIEYFEPNSADFSGKLVVNKIGRAYKEVDGVNFKATKDDNINVTCNEGGPYQTEKHSVAKMTYNVGTSGFLCTGALINTTRNDGEPYFLTANHCLSDNTTAGTLITFFNFEKAYCDGPTLSSQTLSGSTLKATSAKSDFTLLLLSEDPPIDYRPYFAGWDATDTDNFIGGYGIHHPRGKVKKIAITYDSISSWGSSLSWEGGGSTGPDTHWLVEFNKGFTEGGSSGSPVFNLEDRIIGQLHGGSENANFYGKLNTSWEAGSLVGEKLKPHLDPDNSGALVLDGYTPPGVVPESFLYTDFSVVCQGEPIVLQNGSAFETTAYEWRFTPNTVQFHDGTSNTSKEPKVSFDDEVEYDIELKVSNLNGADSSKRVNYIVSGTALKPLINIAIDTPVCYSGFDRFVLQGSGAEFFDWNIISGADKLNYEISASSDSLILSKKAGIVVTNNFYVDIQLKGFHGSCVDSSVQTIRLEVPENDYVENAIGLTLGNNGPFNNKCASVEENEPNPPIGDCSVIGEWCDCELGGPYIENSLWFTFTGPPSGVIGIDCPGFDNQIAVYDASSAADIVSGNSSNYTIISAMDDFYDEAGNFAARIDEIAVTPGKKYWLQVDGSACGASGDFAVNLVDGGISGLNEEKALTSNTKLSVYPSPASSSFTLSGNTNKSITISLISSDGKTYAKYFVEAAHGSSKNTFDLPENIQNGLYILRISDGEKVSAIKLPIIKN